ncbi:hypothetical protein D039_4758B, partial [Vibrio parahaemolyticus EKP-028]
RLSLLLPTFLRRLLRSCSCCHCHRCCTQHHKQLNLLQQDLACYLAPSVHLLELVHLANLIRRQNLSSPKWQL